MSVTACCTCGFQGEEFCLPLQLDFFKRTHRKWSSARQGEKNRENSVFFTSMSDSALQLTQSSRIFFPSTKWRDSSLVGRHSILYLPATEEEI